MKDGYIRVAAASPVISVAACKENAKNIEKAMEKAASESVKLLVFPELCLTGYTASDLFLQKELLDSSERALYEIAGFSRGFDTLSIIGLPVRKGPALYNCAAAVQRGRILGIVPKQNIPNYNEFYEGRHFRSGAGVDGTVEICGCEVPFGNLIFACETMPSFNVGIEICEDMWVPCPPSGALAQSGATIIANPSASTSSVGKNGYRANLVKSQSGRCICGYVLSGCGAGESSTDLVFSGHLIIAENGKTLSEDYIRGGFTEADVDTELLLSERRRETTFGGLNDGSARIVPFSVEKIFYPELKRPVPRFPFVPPEGPGQDARCREVLDIQCAGLAKRLSHIGSKKAIVAVSGGLDSTLALLVSARAIKKYGLSCGITAVTMPGPGTTGRTHGNAGALCRALGASLREIPIGDAVSHHLKAIGHDGRPDTAFENAQARERTQIVMDIANMEDGIVVGTGDMSELALGFTTYNGDHMSMYGVNCGVPKTLVRHLIRYVSNEESGNVLLHDTLCDILATPVSPELLPPESGNIAQKTEQIIGPYELHDFFLYYFLRFGFSPKKILRLSCQAFDRKYKRDEIKSWLVKFLKRFFMSQYKRSCVPDGPKVGSVALSPRGDLRMPSDASPDEWLSELSDEKNY